MKFRLIILFVLLFHLLDSRGQSLQDYNEKFNKASKSGMILLGSWALVNIGAGSIGNLKSSGSTKYFHQMNALWNVVNLGIATVGLLNTQNFTDQSQLTEIIGQQFTLEKAFLTNGALDIGYIMGGLYLTELANRKTKYKERFKGYGKSVILQGSFLFTFDLVMYFIIRDYRLDYLIPYIQNLHINPQQISYIIHF